jgi:hypothetical protein
MKNSAGKSWRTKLEKPMQPKVVDIPEQWAKRIGHGTMLVPTPLVIDKLINQIPYGKVVTVNIIRNRLASCYHTDLTCPLTTGIFLNIAANTAEEDKAKGKTKITPYWRVLKENGCLNSKFPGGVHQQARYLQLEGLDISQGKKSDCLSVKNYEDHLAAFRNTDDIG